MEFIGSIQGAPAPVGPYSVAVKQSGLVFCSGQIGIDPTSGVLRDGFEAQAEQILKNLEIVLLGAGSSWKNVTMVTAFLTEVSQGKVFNQIYQEYLGRGVDLPARQTVVVKDLPMGALIEISVIAACVSIGDLG